MSPAPKRGRPKPLLLGLGGVLLAAGLGIGAWIWLNAGAAPTKEESAPDGFAAFCDDLKRVVFEARTQFTSILGPDRSGVWTARIQLPGWNDCTIRDWTYEGKTTAITVVSWNHSPASKLSNAMRDKLAPMSNRASARIGWSGARGFPTRPPMSPMKSRKTIRSCGCAKATTRIRRNGSCGSTSTRHNRRPRATSALRRTSRAP